jgi:hypothetical protein
MPKGRLTGTTDQHTSAARLHFNEIINAYGGQVMVNLVDKKGNQKELGEHFSTVVSTLAMDRVRYVWFDFHSECKKM